MLSSLPERCGGVLWLAILLFWVAMLNFAEVGEALSFAEATKIDGVKAGWGIRIVADRPHLIRLLAVGDALLSRRKAAAGLVSTHVFQDNHRLCCLDPTVARPAI